MQQFLTTINLPLWAVIALPIAGVIVGMLFLTLSILLLGRDPKRKKSKTVPASTVTAPATTSESEPAYIPIEKIIMDEVRAARDLPKPQPVLKYPRGGLPQKYWYYCDGLDGRFPTLRELLTALGEPIPEKLEMNRIPSAIRSRITRVGVNEPQPDERQPNEKQPTEKATEANTAAVGEPVRRRDRHATPESTDDTIVKKLGDGAYVTVKKRK